MDELIDFVARRSGLERRQAEAAVGAALEYLTARLPSPDVGRMHELLHGGLATMPDAAATAARSALPSSTTPTDPIRRKPAP